MANIAVTRQRSADETPPVARRGLDILVADDDPIFRSLLASRLRRIDGEICEAVDGCAAWSLVRGKVFDLAIIDFDMPGLDGCDLARCLRTHPLTRHIPIVMCTARNDTASMQEAIEAGVSSFLIKPVNWSLFETHVRHLLSMSRAAHEAQQRIDVLESRLHQGRVTIAARARELIRHLETLQGARHDAAAFDQALVVASAMLSELAAPDSQPEHATTQTGQRASSLRSSGCSVSARSLTLD